MPADRSPVLLLLDFDSTLTTRDTTSILASLGYQTRHTPPLPSWPFFVSTYRASFESHLGSYKPTSIDRTTLATEVEWQESLQGVERESISRVEQAGVFKGLTRADIMLGAHEAVNSGDHVKMREGWIDLVLRVQRAGKTKVVSVNWSKLWVHQCLWNSDCEDEGLGIIREEDIYANELEGLDAAEGSTGKILASIVTGSDKARKIKEIVNSEEQGKRSFTTVYIGDSPTDLEALSCVDVGIWMVGDENERKRKKNAAAELTRRIGWDYKPIKKFDWGYLKATREHWKTLWWARNFTDVVESRLEEAFREGEP
ncbi:MAG: hypothetical protein M1834_006542 [Cirrosporium novae-zelandiae]|nr:MAG: hypothetical protein M1834_006542 [Cirrosporium novae-zelandiae]